MRVLACATATIFSVGLVGSGCSPDPAKPVSNASAGPATAPPTKPVTFVEPEVKPVAGAPAPTPRVPEPPEGAAGGVEDKPVDREKFPDPDWFSPALFANARVKTRGHTPPKADGTFASSMLFELSEPMEPQACVDHLTKQISPHLLAVEDPKVGDDGRVTIRGNSDRYRVTYLCGTVDGNTSAFVSYEWTS